MKNLGPEDLTLILQLCECYEEIGDRQDGSLEEMARIIRAIERGGVASVLEGRRVASALLNRFPKNHRVWRYVRILP